MSSEKTESWSSAWRDQFPSFLIINMEARGSHKTDLIDLNVSLRRLRRLRHGRDFRGSRAMNSSNAILRKKRVEMELSKTVTEGE